MNVRMEKIEFNNVCMNYITNNRFKNEYEQEVKTHIYTRKELSIKLRARSIST